MAWSSFRAVEASCLLSPSAPSAALSLEMNFSTRLRIVVAFCSVRSPEADVSRVETVSAASSSGDWTLESPSDVCS